MGIDVYMHWSGQTDEDREAQFTGFSTAHGHTGYLREAYHGRIYATHILVPEGFNENSDEGGTPIPAKVLADRAEAAVHAVVTRYREQYGLGPEDDKTKTAVKSFVDFIELAKRKERETGEPVKIRVSW